MTGRENAISYSQLLVRICRTRTDIVHPPESSLEMRSSRLASRHLQYLAPNYICLLVFPGTPPPPRQTAAQDRVLPDDQLVIL